jgi:hypothetical protein
MLCPFGRRDRHLERRVDAVRLSGLFDEPDHLLDRRDRIALQSKRESEVEHQLGVGRALDRNEQRVVDRVQELAAHAGELADEAVVHPEAACVAERVCLRLLDRRPGRRADVGQPTPKPSPFVVVAPVARAGSGR